MDKAYFHLPGLFEFYEFYKDFLLLFSEHREYFYDFCEIGSIYGAPGDIIWGGGRVGFGDAKKEDVLKLLNEYGISARLTFSNSLLTKEHLEDKKCNDLCRLFSEKMNVQNGVIIYSDLLLEYLKEKYTNFYYVSTTTKVLTDFEAFIKETEREEFSYIVPDFRLNKQFDQLKKLSPYLKDKVEFLCNECCDFACTQRNACYENVSKKCLGIEAEDHICRGQNGQYGYKFSLAQINPGFIGIHDITDIYIPMGFHNFKIEGRGLGSAMLLEFILYYMVKPQFQIHVREQIYLDTMLDLY